MSGFPPEPARLRVLRREVLLAGLALLSCALVLTVLLVAPRDAAGIQHLDDWWYRLMESRRWSPLVTVAKWLSFIGGPLVQWPVRALVTLVLLLKRHWLALGAWVTTVVLSEVCIGPLKALVDRPRPPGSLIATSGASYPSGHAVATAVTAVGIVMALTSGRRRLRWMILAASFGAVMAVSRTYLHAHWLTDTIGGVCIGAGLALAVPESFEVVRDRVRAGPRAAR
jgi:membrane-associated phospholipid phosphatase